jgi:hypothetical protein
MDIKAAIAAEEQDPGVVLAYMADDPAYVRRRDTVVSVPC